MSTTSNMPPEDHRDYWERWNLTSLIPLSVFIPSKSGLPIRAFQREISGFPITAISGEEHVVRRDWEHIQKRRQPQIFVSVILNGRGFFYAENISIDFQPGDLVIYGVAQPYIMGFRGPMSKLIVEVWEETHSDLYSALETETPFLVQAPRSLQTQLKEIPELLASADPRRTESVLDELVLFLSADEDNSANYRNFRRIQSLMVARYTDPEFTVTDMATEAGFSSRQLHRIFVAHGTTPSRALRDLRIDEAVQRLKTSSQPLSEIALASGFSSRQTLARAIYRKYGLLPSEIQK